MIGRDLALVTSKLGLERCFEEKGARCVYFLKFFDINIS
jgi:hypothetical protein